MNALSERILLAIVIVMALRVSAFAEPDGFAAENGMTTGGLGGKHLRVTSGTALHEALCSRPSRDTPVVIEVEGLINHANTTKVRSKTKSCNTADDVIELKEVSNVTIIGVGEGATFDQIGIHLRNAKNIIIRNVTIQNVKKSGDLTSNGGDAIGMEKDVSHVWIDHVTLTADGGEDDGYDALFDIKDNTKYVTLSYSLLEGSDRGGLVGSSSKDLGNGPITYHHNVFRGLKSRVPLLRGAFAHIYSNWYVDIRSTGINSRCGGKALVENNYFQNSTNVMGTFFDEQPGTWDLRGNVFDQVKWGEPERKFKPAGPNPKSTASLSVPYESNLDDAKRLPKLLTEVAGANKSLRTSLTKSKRLISDSAQPSPVQ